MSCFFAGNSTTFDWSRCTTNITENSCPKWRDFNDFGTLELGDCVLECDNPIEIGICYSVSQPMICEIKNETSVTLKEINITRMNRK